MQAYCSLIELGRIEDLMYRLGRIYFGGTWAMNVEYFTRLNLAVSALIILIQDAEILHPKFAEWHRHPTILTTVVMDVRDLPEIPTNRHQFKQPSLENEISSVLFLAEEDVRLKRSCLNMMVLNIIGDGIQRKVFLGNGAKPRAEIVY
jgi:hypothetical protein